MIATIRDVDLKDQRVFVRVDFNVPMDSAGAILDDTRIRAALPTIRYLVGEGAKVILASHLGRPKGQIDPKYSLKPVAKALERCVDRQVTFVSDCIGGVAEATAESLQAGDIALLENLRFHHGETKNDPIFAEQLAKLADVYVNDAFGTVHRAHASTVGVPTLLAKRYSGFLVEKELAFLGEKLKKPKTPFTVILGGAKVSDKIQVIDALLERADAMLIGGAMAYTFMLAQGGSAGSSLVEPDQVQIATQALEKAKKLGTKFILPVDHVVVDHMDMVSLSVGESKVIEGDIPEGWMGVDIGPKTRELYRTQALESKTILWNGPMGVFEIPSCAEGTFFVAHAVAESDCMSIVGGGDSVTAINRSGVAKGISFISTGGGASLEFLEGQRLPGIAAIS